MADPKDELERLIKENRGELVRHRKHKVYQFRDQGKTFVVPSTPECPFAYDNALAALKNVLGLNSPSRGKAGERREKRSRRKSKSRLYFDYKSAIPIKTTWKDKLGLAILQLPLKSKGNQRVKSS